MPEQLYQRFAELGRVVLIQYGPETGKLATIIDIVDQNRALIDGPANLTGVARQVINFKWVALTDYKVKVVRNARQASLTKAWKAADVLNKWNASAWGKKVASKATKSSATDFDRFKAKVAKQSFMKKVKKSIKA